MKPDGLEPAGLSARATPANPGDFDSAVVSDPLAPKGESPRVVIEYRSRGLAWPLVIPLVLLASLVAVSGYHRMMRWSFPHPTHDARFKAEDAVAIQVDTRANKKIEELPAKIEPAPSAAEPLSLSSQRAPNADKPQFESGPGEFVGPPSFKVDDQSSTVVSLVPSPNNSSKTTAPALPKNHPTIEAVLTFAPPSTDQEQPVVNGPPAANPPPAPAVDKTPDEAKQDGTPVAGRDIPSLPAPLPTKEEVLAGIQRESNQMKAERQELKQLKEQTPEILRQAYRAEVRAQRPKFLAEMQEVLRDKQGQAGERIGELHKKYLEAVDPKLQDEMRSLMRRFTGRASLQGRIKALRLLGVPEPTILEVACYEIHRNAHSGRCKCVDPQMYVLAARELIAADKATQSKSKSFAGPAKQASTGNQPVARPQ